MICSEHVKIRRDSFKNLSDLPLPVQHFHSRLVPRPSITANAVEGLVKLLHRLIDVRWTSGGVAYRAVHALALQFTRSATPPDVHLASFYVGVYQAFHRVSCD